MNESLLSFLSLAKKELGGDDARAEIGGRPPAGDRVVYYDAAENFRLVVSFADPPADALGLRARLQELAQGFLESSSAPSVSPTRGFHDDSAAARLDDALHQLVVRAGARVAAVLDRKSPMLWGASLGADQSREVSALIAASEIASTDAPTDSQLLGRAVTLIRSDQDHADGLYIEDGRGFVLRWFAGIYCLVVAFDRSASELKVESSAIRFLPFVEKLMLSLPPLDPGPHGSKAVLVPFRRV